MNNKIQIINNSIKKNIPYKVFIQNTFFKKSIGLCFKNKNYKDFAYYFPFKKSIKESIHMFFVFFPIDIIFCDKNDKIIEIKENLKPFQIYFPKNKFNSFVEFPNKTIKKYNLKLNDKIILK